MFYEDRETKSQVKVYLFVGTLPFSQYCYVEPCLSMTATTWVSCHVNMWNYFKGCTTRLICDNLKAGVISHPVEGDIILNDEYENMANHYGCAIMPAMIKRPKSKASVEGNVGKIATAIIAKLRNYHFQSFIALKNEVEIKLEEYNAKEFDKREGSRLSVFLEEEQSLLNPLPIIDYESYTWVYNRSVNVNSHIAYQKNYYSCNYKYVGKKVDLKITSSRVEIYYKDVRLQIHSLFPTSLKNKYSTIEEDMPTSGRYMEWNQDRIEKWATDIGVHTLKVVQNLFSGYSVKEQGINPALSILNLTKKYSVSEIEFACKLALTYAYSPRYKHLKTILDSNQYKESRSQQKIAAKGFLRGPEYYSENTKEGK